MPIQCLERPNTESLTVLRLREIDEPSAATCGAYHLAPHTTSAKDRGYCHHCIRPNIPLAQVLVGSTITILREEAGGSAVHNNMEIARQDTGRVAGNGAAILVLPRGLNQAGIDGAE